MEFVKHASLNLSVCRLYPFSKHCIQTRSCRILWDVAHWYSIRSTNTVTIYFLFFKAAFKIVKGWLGPDAISMLKFTNKSDVQEYINGEYLPPHMGGTVSMLTFCGPFLID